MKAPLSLSTSHSRPHVRAQRGLYSQQPGVCSSHTLLESTKQVHPQAVRSSHSSPFSWRVGKHIKIPTAQGSLIYRAPAPNTSSKPRTKPRRAPPAPSDRAALWESSEQSNPLPLRAKDSKYQPRIPTAPPNSWVLVSGDVILSTPMGRPSPCMPLPFFATLFQEKQASSPVSSSVSPPLPCHAVSSIISFAHHHSSSSSPPREHPSQNSTPALRIRVLPASHPRTSPPHTHPPCFSHTVLTISHARTRHQRKIS